MNRLIIIVILTIAGLGTIFSITIPQWGRVNDVRAERNQYSAALEESVSLAQLRDELLAQYNAFPPQAIDRLTKLLPRNVDNVRLIIEIDRMARAYGLDINNIVFSQPAESSSLIETDIQDGETQLTDSGVQYERISMEFTVASSYENFLSFVRDLETNLRLIDISKIGFTSASESVDTYTVTFDTYWLGS